MLTQNSLLGKLPTLIPNVAHYALAEGLEVWGDAPVGENSRNDKFDRVKEEPDRLLEGEKAYKIENEKFGKMLLKKEVAMTATKWSVVCWERTVNFLET